jgi:hypothetical protein
MLANQKFAETPALTTVTVKNDDLFFHAHDVSKRNYWGLLLQLEFLEGFEQLPCHFR